jgi:hypothetical protein
MKTFIIVLPVVTVSTILAVCILTGAVQDLQEAVSKTVPDPGQKLHGFMLEHRRKKWGKEQLHDMRASGEQIGVWKYAAFFMELCLITFPVHEVKEAINLYGLRKRRASPSNISTMSQTNLRSTTTLTFGYGTDAGEANAKTRAQQVIEIKAKLEKRKGARGSLILTTLRRAPLIALRILLLCLWIPLLLLEYIILLIYCPFTNNFPEPPTGLESQHVRITKREKLKGFFINPVLFLGFDPSQLYSWRRGREHPSPLPTSGTYDHALGTLPQTPDHKIRNGPSGLGREQHGRGAQRIRHVIAQPNFQAAYGQQQQQYLSGQNPTVSQGAQNSATSRADGYNSTSKGPNSRPGGPWMGSGGK